MDFLSMEIFRSVASMGKKYIALHERYPEENVFSENVGRGSN